MGALQTIEAAGAASEAKRMTHNDADRLAAAVSLHSPTLYGLALRKLGNVEDAEDALQDAFLSAFKNMHQFRGQARFSTWLGTIVLNSARMQLRRRLSHSFVPLDVNDDNYKKGEPILAERLEDRSPDAEETFRRTQARENLEQVIQRLPKSLRATFRLRVFDGLRTSEVAAALGVPVGTIKARFFRARMRVIVLMRNAVNSPQKKNAPAFRR